MFPVHSHCSAPFLKYLPSSRTAGLIHWVGFPPISGQPLELGLGSFTKALSSPRLKDALQSTHSTSVAASLRLTSPLRVSFAGQFGHQENKPFQMSKAPSLDMGTTYTVLVRALCIIKAWTLCCQQRPPKVPLLIQFQYKVGIFLALTCLPERYSCFSPLSEIHMYPPQLTFPAISAA